MIDFLATTVETFSGYGMPYGLSFIGEFIKVLIEGFGSIGLGIIVFTVILKLITLPLDIYSRVSTKKMALKQEAMKPELEKLQRQYANNKELYNQKMQALYKKQGVSMLSSCLPMIVTVIFFIIVINQFTAYSNYTNLSMINGMAGAYTDYIVNYNETSGNNVLNVVEQSVRYGDEGEDENGVEKNTIVYHVTVKDEAVYSLTELSAYGIEMREEDGSYSFFATDLNRLGELIEKYKEKGFDADKIVGSRLIKTDEGYAINSAIIAAGDEDKVNAAVSADVADFAFKLYIEDNILDGAREAAAEVYRKEAPSFLWVKNLWVPDLPWRHPVFAAFSEYSFRDINPLRLSDNENAFDEITYNLSEEKNAPNGYLILVVLSIGIMLLSQLIMQKTQKTQMELSSVDGQGAQTSKMMMWMMPIMFGVFAFIYNASFSIYMIVSSGLSTVSTLVINKIVENRFRKKAEEEAQSSDKRFFKK